MESNNLYKRYTQNHNHDKLQILFIENHEILRYILVVKEIIIHMSCHPLDSRAIELLN